MLRITRTVICAACLSAVGTVQAETITFTYDALGRLRNASVSGGPANGVQRSYDYDAADNRTQYVVSGSSASGSITITPAGTVANTTSVGVTLTVNISGSSPPSGMVTFTENGTFLGSAFVYAGQATVILEGFPKGTHTITASYSGDGANAPYSYSFTIKVQNLSWLPAVLEILLSN